MNIKETKKLNYYFNGLYSKHGLNDLSTGYSKQGHRARFDCLNSLIDLKGKSILEIGCGLGHFLAYLEKKYKKVNYTGYDINANFISQAKKKFPQYKFKQRNIMNKPLAKNSFDAVFFIGGFNYSFLKNPESLTKEIMKKMFLACRRVAAISMLSIYVDKGFKYSENHYYDPMEIFKYAKKITKKVNLYHNYLANDFTIALYK